ncbi:MAG: serine/threonine protein kinase [Planctomycetia bacterium]|nr:serine/threonine protein kinase [Planctomycetia bacterium]
MTQSGDAIDVHVTLADQRPDAASTRFAYEGGSKPLSGYTIKRAVGRGGFGEVYYAQSDGGKEVAVKLIRRNLDVELRGVGHCLNLKHPNLIGLYDIRKDDFGDSWVVMEYVRGDSLESVVDRNPSGMPEDQVLWWIHGIGQGVAYLHDQGIVHRDLKPGNIFNDEGFVKIGDYGLSKFISASRRSGQTESVGTVHYMAPEIANGRYGKEIDIYALGIILFEMLTGQVPFEGESVGEVLMKHLTAEPDLSKLKEPYKTTVARALTKDPQQRHATVREFLRSLPPPGDQQQNVPPPRGLPVPQGITPPRKPPPGYTGLVSAPIVAPAPGPGNVAAASPYGEEPIWKAIRGWFQQMGEKFNSPTFPAGARVMLIVLVVVAAVFAAQAWVPIVLTAVAVYFIYYAIRALVILCKSPPPPAAPVSPFSPSPGASPGQSPGAAPQALPAGAEVVAYAPAGALPPVVYPAHYGRMHRRHARQLTDRERLERGRAMLAAKTLRQKASELTGSLLLSAAVVTAVSVLVTLLFFGADEPSLRWRQFAWLALVGTAGAWGVLVPSKLWEGRDGEPLLRRFTLLCVGLGMGAFSFFVSDALYLDLPAKWGALRPPVGDWTGLDLFTADGAMTLTLHLAYGAFLLPVLRWWKQADPLRSGRLGFWATGVCVAWAWVLSLAWPFRQPWGMLLAAVIAVGVQLSSTWLSRQAIDAAPAGGSPFNPPYNPPAGPHGTPGGNVT